MNMVVGDFLATIGPGIGERPVARLCNAEIPGDLADGTGETGNFLI
jgi:hypothetical protein